MSRSVFGRSLPALWRAEACRQEPRYRVPDDVPVPDHSLRPALPELTVL